tara:strand:+ start:882 stop:1487 length:606 start_codon:yes stop_codon:yes gene_type:complete
VAVGNFWSAGYTRFSSDDRVKHFEEEISGLEVINQLIPYKYKKTNKIYTEDYTGEIGEEGKDWEWEIGLIAQEIKKIPYLEFTVSDPDTNPEGKYGLNYTNFIGLCIQGIKEVDRQLQSEKNKVATMELLVASLVKRVGDLENNVETLGKLLKEERDRFQVYVTRYSYQMMQTFKQEMEAHITRACVRISNMITHPPEYGE